MYTQKRNEWSYQFASSLANSEWIVNTWPAKMTNLTFIYKLFCG